VTYTSTITRQLLLVLCGISAFVPAYCQTESHVSPGAARRTVTQSEIGLIFAYPNGFSWRDVGALVNTPGSKYFAQMSPDALKIQHGRFQHFSPSDDNHNAFFPYFRLKEYDAQEVVNGRQPLFVTATYQGKKRPVYFEWSLALQNNLPKSPSQDWMQAVDVSSDRFLDFWVNQYVRRELWKNRPASPDQWVGLDNCAFRSDLYGVLDDNGRFVPNVPWDAPFAQTPDQYLASIKLFFHKLAGKAPDIKTMCNIGSLADWGQFKAIYAEIPGVMQEDIAEANPREFARTGEYNLLTALSWFGSEGRPAVLRALLSRGSTEQIRTAYMFYLLVKGPNFFFAPEFTDHAAAVPRDKYADTRAALGEPTDSMKIVPVRPKNTAYNLYSRTYQHGIVYVNWTGSAQEMILPGTNRYFDFEGKPVTRITLPDLTGTYVTTEKLPNK
jgi:hypothetical protein